MFYCDLCHKYLPRVDPAKSDEALESHCKSTYHQNAYVKAKQEEFEKQQSGQEEKLDEEKNGNVSGEKIQLRFFYILSSHLVHFTETEYLLPFRLTTPTMPTNPVLLPQLSGTKSCSEPRILTMKISLITKLNNNLFY